MNKITLIVTTSLLAPLIEMRNDIAWMSIVAILLVLNDLFFGIKKSIKSKIEIRFSKALRRSVDKIFSYICWVVLSCAFGITFGEKFDFPLLTYFIFGIVCIIELNSIFANYLEWKGINKRINIFRFFDKYDNVIEDIDEKKEEKEVKND